MSIHFYEDTLDLSNRCLKNDPHNKKLLYRKGKSLAYLFKFKESREALQ